jgi:PncC family amidohydrolase
MVHNIDQINRAGRLLLQMEATIAVAESVTSGNLQVAFSLAENATLFFQGGITAYNIGQKCRHLLVEPIHAIATNCVSKQVSEQLATGVCGFFKSDFGIGITGYASPVPEKNIKQLFAYVAIAKGQSIVTSKKITTRCEKPLDVQIDFTYRAIQLLVNALKKDKKALAF